VVLDEQGEPLPGARVTLRRDDDPEAGPVPAETDARGRWALIGLAGGRWRITIEAADYLTSNGFLEVPEEGPSPPLKVELRRLAEGLPRGLESGLITVRSWLEKGNSLLAQGRTAEARAEFERALPALPPEERPQVLRSLARTHFLEQNHEAAVAALKESLLYAPRDAASRELLTLLLSELGRGEEARTWLARLEAEGPEALADEVRSPDEPRQPGGAPARPAELPTEPASAHRMGRYRTAFAERSRQSDLEALAARFTIPLPDLEAADPERGRYDLAAETFEVYVPESYRRDRPAGLLVWISPGPRGGLWDAELKRVLAEHGMIWVGANRSGNERSKWVRMGLALDAVENASRLYAVDPERVYVSGYSGGGRTASALALLFPEVFRGGFCVMGVDYFRRVSVPDRPGAHWPPAYPQPPRPALSRAREQGRYVLLTGELDFNRAQTKAYFAEFKRDGFAHVTYLEIPGATHYDGVDAEWFARALAALDPLPAASSPG
jgi:tetratricopeptide (TPR) repeat protein